MHVNALLFVKLSGSLITSKLGKTHFMCRGRLVCDGFVFFVPMGCGAMIHNLVDR